MAGSNKKVKRSKKEITMISPGVGVGDQLSSLSDTLLQQILSHLTLTDAVRLSTLSKRWRKLWTLLPSLDFTRFYPSSLPGEEATIKAMNMISHVLIHSRARLLKSVTIYLPFYSRYCEAFLRWCISIAVTRNVDCLAVAVQDSDGVCVPPSYIVGRFSSLTHLHLSSCALSLPESTCSFSLLRSMHIISLVDLVGAELERLTSSDCCPVLEMLKLSKCNECDPLTLSLSNPSIRHLHISVQSCQREKLEIAAPYVTHLKLVGAWRRYMVTDLSAAVEVILDFDLVSFPWHENDKAVSFSVFNSLFDCVPSSAKLILSPWFLQVLQVAKSENLVTSSTKAKNVIVITGPDYSDIPDIVFFLNSHNIEHLTVNMSNKMHLNKIFCHTRCGCDKVGLYTQGIEDPGKKYCMLFEQSLSFNNNLKTIVLDGFYEECGNMKAEKYCSYVHRSWQFELARIILGKLQKLEKMILKGRSIQLGISSLVAELCCSLPKAVSTTIIECYDIKACLSGKKELYQSCESIALHSCDRLSLLANELLLNILSFLNLREAICTGVLSKRWKRLWRLLPVLDFTNDTFDLVLWKRSEIINQVLAQHEASTLSSFCLYNCYFVDAQHDSWIAFAISRHVQRLVLHLHRYVLPPYLYYYSKSLTYLELNLCVITLPQHPFSFPSLKVLQIGGTIVMGELLEKLTSSVCCPVLEKLQLVDFFLTSLLRVNLSNPSLTELYLRPRRCGRLAISAPSVSHLMILGLWEDTCDVELKCMSSLKEITFDLDESQGTHLICWSLEWFLRALPPHVKVHFSTFVREILIKCGVEEPSLLSGDLRRMWNATSTNFRLRWMWGKACET